MNILKTTNNRSNSLLLFFNGWGFDENCVQHLITDNFDVCMVSDYRSLEPFDIKLVDDYKSITVLAWSYGVWVANAVLQPISSKITNAYAINGTLFPVNDTMGIPTKIFDITLRSLTENSYPKFLERIMGNAENLERNRHLLAKRLFVEQKNELECLSKHFLSTPNHTLSWTKAICSQNDKIVPIENQKQFWREKGIKKPYSHFIFDKYTTWEQLLNEFEHV